MKSVIEFSPLKSIAIPNVGRVAPKGLVLVIGPNSAGKTQLLRDIHGRMLGRARKLVVCDDIEIQRPESLDSVLESLYAMNHIRKTADVNNNVKIESLVPAFGDTSGKWSLHENQVRSFFSSPLQLSNSAGEGTSDKFLEHFGRSFIVSLFLDRRLTITNSVSNFDYEHASPENELQALYVDSLSKQMLASEARSVFGKSIWVDNTRANTLCLRVGDGPDMPSAEDRLEPEKMKAYRLIEDEGDGFKSYMAICLTLLLAQRPVVLIDEPEMCLHPPQAYALGRFIGRHGVSTDRTTFVATHSSHVLRGIIEETEQLDVIRLSRVGSQFTGRRVSSQILKASIEKPSTKSESVLDGLFAEAVTVVESEGDRLVYGTAWDKVANEFEHDIHFVSVGGLGGIADPCVLYRNLKIPVCVAVDLDIVRELGTFERILNAVASADSTREMMEKCRDILSAVKVLGPVIDETSARSQLSNIMADQTKWQDDHLRIVRHTLGDLHSGLSPTSRLKRGVSSFSEFPVYHDLVAFIRACRSVGVFLVPVGELEDWLAEPASSAPSKKNKAEWANFAAGRIRETPARTDDVWEFVRSIASFQRDEGTRLAGYPDRKT